MNPLTRLKEWLHAHIYGDQGTGHPSYGYNSKIARWREHLLEPTEHKGHERSTTKARYGDFVVCYCYDCGEHYRQTVSRLPADSVPPHKANDE